MREFGKRLHVVNSQNIEGPLKIKRITSLTYHNLRKSVAIQTTKVQRNWNNFFSASGRRLDY